MDAPVGGVGRDDVEVAVDQQRRPGRILARHPGDDTGPVRAGLQDRGFQPYLGQERRNMLGGLALARSRVIARVRGVDPDQVAGQVHDLVPCGDAGTGALESHAAMLPLLVGRAAGDVYGVTLADPSGPRTSLPGFAIVMRLEWWRPPASGVRVAE